MDKKDCLYAFELPLDSALKALSQYEMDNENGEWIYFNQNGNKVNALYKSEVERSGDSNLIPDLNNKFIDFFLGRFSVEAGQKVEITTDDNFVSFCLTLNKLLNDKIKIFDLSRVQFWIWSERDGAISLSPKLKNFLEV